MRAALYAILKKPDKSFTKANVSQELGDLLTETLRQLLPGNCTTKYTLATGSGGYATERFPVEVETKMITIATAMLARNDRAGVVPVTEKDDDAWRTFIFTKLENLLKLSPMRSAKAAFHLMSNSDWKGALELDRIALQNGNYEGWFNEVDFCTSALSDADTKAAADKKKKKKKSKNKDPEDNDPEDNDPENVDIIE
ncbi:hypothetical protein WR25_05286 [Diploscapter pachys]|uniref:Uncharacterized protein n=1 Tax=Diploscapter pachys TaxID=2018661 RepID=A0A2A2KNS9_9BILA|nr:hypothetical protein WR25_05286 [Diploscapter pachys]